MAECFWISGQQGKVWKTITLKGFKGKIDTFFMYWLQFEPCFWALAHNWQVRAPSHPNDMINVLPKLLHSRQRETSKTAVNHLLCRPACHVSAILPLSHWTLQMLVVTRNPTHKNWHFHTLSKSMKSTFVQLPLFGLVACTEIDWQQQSTSGSTHKIAAIDNLEEISEYLQARVSLNKGLSPKY